MKMCISIRHGFTKFHIGKVNICKIIHFFTDFFEKYENRTVYRNTKIKRLIYILSIPILSELFFA